MARGCIAEGGLACRPRDADVDARSQQARAVATGPGRPQSTLEAAPGLRPQKRIINNRRRDAGEEDAHIWAICAGPFSWAGDIAGVPERAGIAEASVPAPGTVAGGRHQSVLRVLGLRRSKSHVNHPFRLIRPERVEEGVGDDNV